MNLHIIQYAHMVKPDAILIKWNKGNDEIPCILLKTCSIYKQQAWHLNLSFPVLSSTEEITSTMYYDKQWQTVMLNYDAIDNTWLQFLTWSMQTDSHVSLSNLMIVVKFLFSRHDFFFAFSESNWLRDPKSFLLHV